MNIPAMSDEMLLGTFNAGTNRLKRVKGAEKRALISVLHKLLTEIEKREKAAKAEPTCDCGEPDVYDGWAECEMHPSED